MIFVSPSLAGWVGRGFCRVIRRFPAVFLLCCAGGMVVGGMAVFDFGQPSPSTREIVFMRSFGVFCLLFYGWFALQCVRKWRQGRWQDTCDWAYGVLEGR